VTTNIAGQRTPKSGICERHVDLGDLREEREPSRRRGRGSDPRVTLQGSLAYATAKTVDEILTQAYWSDRGLPTIVARLFNCVGPRQTGEFGMVLPRFLRQALAAEDVTVYGDGRQRRCFCHVKDTVAGLLALLDHPDAVGDVFNVGANNEMSMTDLAREVIERTGSSSRIVYVPYEQAYEEDFEDVQRRVPDIAKIALLTGWRPTRTMDDILTDAIAHERENASVGGSR
jgi:UDP-glucose 4-epimerase